MSTETIESTASTPPKMALLRTARGETIELLDRPPLPDKAAKATDRDDSGGAIYTDELPKIEELLERYEIQFAVLDKVAEPIGGVHSREEQSGDGAKVAYLPMLFVGGLPAATFAAGLVMLVGVFLGGSVVSNAYVAMLFFLGGLGLGITAYVALNEDAGD